MASSTQQTADSRQQRAMVAGLTQEQRLEALGGWGDGYKQLALANDAGAPCPGAQSHQYG